MADSDIKIVSEIALATEGVSGIAFPGVLPIPTGKNMNLEVYINVDYGVSIPEICWKVQENISQRISSIWGLKLNKINIHVENISVKNRS